MVGAARPGDSLFMDGRLSFGARVVAACVGALLCANAIVVIDRVVGDGPGWRTRSVETITPASAAPPPTLARITTADGRVVTVDLSTPEGKRALAEAEDRGDTIEILAPPAAGAAGVPGGAGSVTPAGAGGFVPRDVNGDGVVDDGEGTVSDPESSDDGGGGGGGGGDDGDDGTGGEPPADDPGDANDLVDDVVETVTDTVDVTVDTVTDTVDDTVDTVTDIVDTVTTLVPLPTTTTTAPPATTTTTTTSTTTTTLLPLPLPTVTTTSLGVGGL